jgi:hypothetical protein
MLPEERVKKSRAPLWVVVLCGSGVPEVKKTKQV